MTEQQYLMILGTIYIAHINGKFFNGFFGVLFISISIGQMLGWWK